MYVVSALCLLLTFLEICHLGISGIRDNLKGRSTVRRSRQPLHSSGLPSQHATSLLKQVPSAPPGYHSVLKKDTPGRLRPEFRELNLKDSGRESPGDELAGRDLERMRRHLKMAQQHLDQAYQSEELAPVSRSSSPESSSKAAEQNQLNYAQEKQASTSDKGVCVCGRERLAYCACV